MCCLSGCRHSIKFWCIEISVEAQNPIYNRKESCLSVCLFVCMYCMLGQAYLHLPGSDLCRIWLAHAESRQIDREAVVFFRSSLETTRFLPSKLASTRARISLERRVGSPPNVNYPFSTSNGRHGACRLLPATTKKAIYFYYIRVFKMHNPPLARIHASNSCYVRYACFPQRQQRLSSDDVQRDCRNGDVSY